MKDANRTASPDTRRQQMPEPGEPEPFSTPLPSARLSELLGIVLKETEQAENIPLVARIDPMPLVDARPDELKKAFKILISTIVPHAPQGKRLFLHIRCENTGVYLMDIVSRKRLVRFKVNLCTNIAAGQQWLQQYAVQLASVQRQLSQNHISFECHPDNAIGCLFSLTLSGKPES